VGLVDQLAITRERINSMGVTRAGLSTELGNAVNMLNDALVQVASIQQAFDAIESSVQGVSLIDPAKVGRPVTLVVRPLAGASRLASIYPALLVLVIAFGALVLAPRLVHIEREAGAELRLSLVLSSHELRAIATACTGVILVAGQAFLLVLLSIALFGGVIVSPISTFFVALIVGTIFMLLGCALAYVLPTEEASLLAALSLGTLLFILSGSILPVERTVLTSYNPLMLASDLVRQTATYGMSYFEAPGSLWLLLELLVALLVCYGALSFAQRSVLQNLLHKGKK
jgi:hypothetical protein